MMPNTNSDPAINGLFGIVHKYACRVLALMVFIHVLAVVHHHPHQEDTFEDDLPLDCEPRPSAI